MTSTQTSISARTGRQVVEEWTFALRVIHWASAVFIIGMIVLGLYMKHATIDAGAAFDLYQWHKSFGFVVLVLTAARVAVRSRRARPPFPQRMPALEIVLAKATHTLFYGLLMALPLLGWIMVSAAPLPIPTQLFDLIPIPHLMAPNEAVYDAARLAHRFAAWGLAALILLHVLAALKHHFADQDATLRRMLFRWRDAS